MKKDYEILRDFMSKEETQEYVKVCERVLQQAYKDPENPHYTWYSDVHLNKINSACKFVPEFLQLASHPALCSKAKELLNTDSELDVYISKFFPMTPNGGVSTFMHQDNYYFRGDQSRILSCAVYLQDTSKENGCLRLAKNSHWGGVIPHRLQSKHDPGIHWISDLDANKYEIYDCELPAPYAVFFNIDTIHGCYMNNSNETRFSLAWEYIERNNSDVPNYNHISYDRNQTL